MFIPTSNHSQTVTTTHENIIRSSENDSFSHYYDYNQGDWLSDQLELMYKILRASQWTTNICLTSFLSLIFTLGVTGNILVLIVFSQSKTKHASTILIIGLASNDLIICGIVLPGVLLKEWYVPFQWDPLCKGWEWVRCATIPLSSFILMVIAVDRYILICQVGKTKTISVKQAKYILMLVAFVSVCHGIPSMVRVGVYQADDNSGTIYLGLCLGNDLLVKQDFVDRYWQAMTAEFALVLVIVVVLYCLVFRTVHMQNRRWPTVHKHPKLVPSSIRTVIVKKQTDDHNRRKTGCGDICQTNAVHNLYSPFIPALDINNDSDTKQRAICQHMTTVEHMPVSDYINVHNLFPDVIVTNEISATDLMNVPNSFLDKRATDQTRETAEINVPNSFINVKVTDQTLVTNQMNAQNSCPEDDQYLLSDAKRNTPLTEAGDLVISKTLKNREMEDSSCTETNTRVLKVTVNNEINPNYRNDISQNNTDDMSEIDINDIHQNYSCDISEIYSPDCQLAPEYRDVNKPKPWHQNEISHARSDMTCQDRHNTAIKYNIYDLRIKTTDTRNMNPNASNGHKLASSKKADKFKEAWLSVEQNYDAAIHKLYRVSTASTFKKQEHDSGKICGVSTVQASIKHEFDLINMSRVHTVPTSGKPSPNKTSCLKLSQVTTVPTSGKPSPNKTSCLKLSRVSTVPTSGKPSPNKTSCLKLRQLSETLHRCCKKRIHPTEETKSSTRQQQQVILQPSHQDHCCQLKQHLQSTKNQPQDRQQHDKLLQHKSSKHPEQHKQQQDVNQPKRYSVAQVKTAKVLLLVTVVYIASFAPVLLMILNVIPSHPIPFYGYFIHSAANPIIYSFINPAFRKQLQRLVIGKRKA